VTLSPLGSARARVTGRDDGYPTELLATLEDAGLGEAWLYLAWQLAAWARGLDPSERRQLAATAARCFVAAAGGSTRVDLDDHELALVARAPEVVGPPGSRRPLVLEGRFLYEQRLLACEARVAAAVRGRAGLAADEVAAKADAASREVTDAVPPPTPEQAAAVRRALTARFTVVTGGPGSGKTTVALAMVRALVRAGVAPESIALAAPTGKAANRLEEALRAGLARLPGGGSDADRTIGARLPAAQTLHRLLGYSATTGSFQHHHNNRLATRAVLVDEASMIDLALMDRLLRALPDEARLVLLGDPDQLPSVAAGAVLRDLGSLAVRLDASHRMDPRDPAGHRLLEAARAARAGDVAGFRAVADARATAAALTGAGVERLPAAEREPLLERWYEARIARPPELDALAQQPVEVDGAALAPDAALRLAPLLRHALAARVLCVTHGRETGTIATNAWFHRRAGANDDAERLPGEPVMMLRNDYDRGLWNGDQGVLVRTRGRTGDVGLRAAFPTRAGWAAWDVASFGDGLALAYALTVHKAQGSELDAAALLLPATALPLVTRELLYTGLTRSRRSVVVCGEDAVLAAALATPLARSSGLAERLAR
jgi:exodeoxyribonuclease V alpha subunit